MIVFRRRLIIWLIRAYIRKWGKFIITSFVLGLIVFFIVASSSSILIKLLPIQKKEVIGVQGAYKVSQLPPVLESKLSRGLTKVNTSGDVLPDVASSWKIEDNGKKYTIALRKDVYFADGKNLTSDTLSYDFSDVEVKRPDKYTIAFILMVKDGYSPFLVSLSKPIFRKGLVGLGDYRVDDIELNGDFIKFVKIVSRKNRLISETYQFYPTEEAMKVSFMMGETKRLIGLSDKRYGSFSFDSFPNVETKKITSFHRLVTLFYNTKDSVLSDDKVRRALTFALPDIFPHGQRNPLPYVPGTWYYNNGLGSHSQDFAKAATLIEDTIENNEGKPQQIAIKTLEKYEDTAEQIAKSWNEIGIQTKIETVDARPDVFQVYLGDFNVPEDPDQYTLWHQNQINNITKYVNLRIDKLLEDGRKSTDQTQRQEIYYDFQKYLLEDAPAAFLYFPYEYEIVRK